MRLSIGLAAIIAITPVSAQAQEICAALERLVAASREDPAFESVHEALLRGEPPILWPADERHSCEVAVGEEVSCWRWDGMPEGWQGIDSCADTVQGMVAVEPRPHRHETAREPRPGRLRMRTRNRGSYRAFMLEGLYFDYGTGCPGCHVIPFGFTLRFDEEAVEVE